MCVSLGLVLWVLGGCPLAHGTKSGVYRLPPEVEKLGPTIRSVAQVAIPQPIAVEGYGLVAGLMGTGSESCPPDVLSYLRRFVSSEVPNRTIDVERLVASKATAVVYLEGVVPRAALQGDRFDVKLTELTGNPEVSLAGGWLYAAELWPKGEGPSTRVLARVEGASAVFHDYRNAVPARARIPYVLGGGFVVNPGQAYLAQAQVDFRRANTLRNQINTRFQLDTVEAQSGSRFLLTVPIRYRLQRERFFGVLESLYLEQNQLLLAQRAETLNRALISANNRVPIAWHLEGLGAAVLPKLSPLLEHENDAVRLEAAHCMLDLGSTEGLAALIQMLGSPDFPEKREAAQVLLAAGAFTEVGGILQSLFSQVDLETAKILFEEMTQVLDARLMARSLPGVEMGGGLVLHELPQTSYRMIAVSRRLGARLGLFGGPLSCNAGAYVETEDGSVVVDTRAGQQYALVTRKLPGSAGVLGPLTSSRRLTDVIQVLCSKPDSENITRGGCGLPYAELLPLLDRMCNQGMVEAHFHLGPPSEIVH